MFYYYLAYLLMLVSAILLEECREIHLLCRKNSKKFYCIIYAAIWIVLLGLRHPSMGVDLGYGTNNGYLASYKYIGQLSWKFVWQRAYQNYELGYRLFNKCLYMINTDPQFLLFCCASLSVIAVSVMIYRYSDLPYLSSVIYLGLPVFLANYSALRQILAIAITMYSFQFIKNRKFFKFFVAVLIASLFHYAAIIFLAAYPIYHLKMKNWTTAGSVLMIPVFYILKGPLFILLSKLLKRSVVFSDNNAGFLFLVFYLVYIFAVVFEQPRDSEEIGYRNLFYCACFCQIFASIYDTAMRVGWFFMPYLALLLPKIIVNNRSKDTIVAKRNTLIIYVGIGVCFALFGLSILSGHGWARSNPYYFFWY